MRIHNKPWFIPFNLFMGATVGLSACREAPQTHSLAPNVVFIMIDDLGWADLGYMGSGFYETPRVDELASEGLVFMHAYAGASNCAPSRATLMTGMNTPRHGIYTVSPSERGDARTRQLIPIANNDSLIPSTYTLAHLFSDMGYQTCAIGKWHLSNNPLHNGFHINIGGDHRGNPGQNGFFAPYNIDHIKQGAEGEYLTDRLTDEAINFISDNQHQAFFLYMSYYTVHTPLQGKEHVVDYYREKSGTPEHNNPVYAAMIASMDENTGRILDVLDELGLAENTLVVFTSDNGGIRGISKQNPLRAGKGSYYEGGIRIPLIMRWPGNIEPGVTNEPMTFLDFFPTFMSVLGVESVDHERDGDDLYPLLHGESLGQRPLYWHFPVYLQQYRGAIDQARDPLFRTRPGSVMRYGRWKLHEYFEDGTLELYDLESDPGENLNLAGGMKEKTDSLHRMLQQWRSKMHAPVPEQRNPLYDREYEYERIRQFQTEETGMLPVGMVPFIDWLAEISEKP